VAVSIVAPCGLICDLCAGFQRKKNRCPGCLKAGNPLTHCQTCSILNCPEKHGISQTPCNTCPKYPCRRLKNLEKRYVTQYGESLMENFRRIREDGMEHFLAEAEKEWTCPGCGALLCAHRAECMHCGQTNSRHHKAVKEIEEKTL
jgi:hypothetical protein